MAEVKFASVDEYIGSFPADVQADVQEVLQEARRRLHDVVPGAGEKTSYQIPTITLDGKALVYFSAWKKHISVYPIPPVDDALAAELEPYKAGKGTLKFPLEQPIPYDLIARVAKAFLVSRA